VSAHDPFFQQGGVAAPARVNSLYEIA